MDKINNQNFLSEVWHDINQGGTALWVLLLLIAFYFVYKKIDKVFDFYKEMIIEKTKNKIDYNKVNIHSLQNHPFFINLEYRKDNTPTCLIADADRGKVKIANDLLKIYYTVVYEKFITWKKENFIEWSNDYLKTRVTSIILDINSSIWDESKKAGIPDAFLKKFSIIMETNQNNLQENVMLVIQTDLPIPVLEKIYIVLNYFQTFIDTVIANMPKTVLNVNGDLKGLTYKGIVIGCGDGSTRKYLPPDLTFTAKVHPFLADLIHKCHASRCKVMYFHDYKDKIIDGMYSVVYEASCPGVSNGNCAMAYQYCSVIENIINEITKKKFGKFKMEDCTIDFRYLMRDEGTNHFFVVPIMNANKVIGMLSVEWLSFLNSDIEENKIKSMMVESAENVAKYLCYHEIRG